MDYYKILNLKEDASIKEIEQAYLDLSSFYNPENNVSKIAYKRFREINKAYNILKETKSRELYNLSIKDKKINNLDGDDGNKLDINDFDKNEMIKSKDISLFKDVSVDEEFSDYTRIDYSIHYLYYLVNSEYLVEYPKKEIISMDGVCPSCLGLGKVKSNNKVVYCKDCLSSGKNIKTREKIVKEYISVDDYVVDNENKIIYTFNFTGKQECEIVSNIITIKHIVSEEEYYNGFNITLKVKDNILEIKEHEFTNHKSYVFLDKVINIEYILTSYKGRDKRGYLLTDKDVIYLNPKDYSYSFISNDKCNYRVDVNDKVIVVPLLGERGFNSSNGDLILDVIKVKNEENLYLFFDKKIKKVSASLFKFKGEAYNHIFNGTGIYSYDENYIYLPSRAYKLKLKYFYLFKIIFALVPILLSLILFFIFGISLEFFILSFISIVVFTIGINLLMEVKI